MKVKQHEAIRKFKEFHAKNPEVYTYFRYFMLEMLKKKKHVSARLAYERTRWEVLVEVDTDDQYKFNNNFCPAYCRLFLNEHPHYQDLVETRSSLFDVL